MKVLILDDEPNMRSSLKEFLALEGIEALPAADCAEAKALLEKQSVEACVVDLRLSGESGMDFLEWLKKDGPDLPAIMISAHGGVRDAVQALKSGAVDYIEKPFDPEELSHKLKKAVQERRLKAVVELGKKDKESALNWVGESKAIQSVKRMARKAAPTPSTVLITGESGTGKEICARFIHAESERSDGPFVAVNVGALPEQLLESELFGYEKGAFTGADSRKPGIFELASGGTLFLDEIGEMPSHLQVKLLRVIQDRRITRLGGTRPMAVDVRIIAATNKRLEEELRQGRFREDLYYRLNVIRIEMPPLRERKEDVPALAIFFIGKISKELGKKLEGISNEALAALVAYDFPGNVRELENAIERAVIMTDSESLEREDFSFFDIKEKKADDKRNEAGSEGGAKSQTGQPSNRIKDLEREAILRALGSMDGHREKSAAELGMTRRTLLNKIKEYRIEDSEWSKG
jgi:two-component system, NtrC family, response regulator AtoC